MRESTRWRWAPAALTGSRFIFGPLIYELVTSRSAGGWVFAALAGSMLSDVFDGVIARRLKIVTLGLRRADSLADAWLFAWIGFAVWTTHGQVLNEFRWPIAIEAVLLLGSYAFDLIRQGRIATLHAYTAKVWGFSLYVAAAGVLVWGASWPMWIAFGCGLLSFADALAIKLLLPESQYDVLSAIHAGRLRRVAAAHT